MPTLSPGRPGRGSPSPRTVATLKSRLAFSLGTGERMPRAPAVPSAKAATTFPRPPGRTPARGNAGPGSLSHTCDGSFVGRGCRHGAADASTARAASGGACSAPASAALCAPSSGTEFCGARARSPSSAAGCSRSPAPAGRSRGARPRLVTAGSAPSSPLPPGPARGSGSPLQSRKPPDAPGPTARCSRSPRSTPQVMLLP